MHGWINECYRYLRIVCNNYFIPFRTIMRHKSHYFYFCLRKMYSIFLYVKWRWRNQELMTPGSKKTKRDFVLMKWALSQLMLLIKSRDSYLINKYKVHNHPTLYACMSLLCTRSTIENLNACVKWNLKNKFRFIL